MRGIRDPGVEREDVEGREKSNADEVNVEPEGAGGGAGLKDASGEKGDSVTHSGSFRGGKTSVC